VVPVKVGQISPDRDQEEIEEKEEKPKKVKVVKRIIVREYPAEAPPTEAVYE
jgi:hypothetical protein